MLSKFLFIGLGGSGGKTLQFLHQNLDLRLKSVNKPMPKAWQFLWFDVPSTPDLLDPGSGVKPLPNKYYQALGGGGLDYVTIDDALVTKGGDIHNEMAQWSPDPSRVAVPISLGAGQFRAVGRVVTMSKYEEIGRKIDLAMSDIDSTGVDAELRQLAKALNIPIEDDATSRHPQIVIVCSLAGGSGAGSIIDVSDIVRAKVTNKENWKNSESVGLLYTPDVFEGEVEGSNIEANSLFALSEIVNGFFDSKPGVRPESDLLPQFGIEKPSKTQRGPDWPFLIGKSNGKITFDEPQDIFRNTGRLLSSWCLDPKITNEIAFNTLGNWPANCLNYIKKNNTGLFHSVSNNDGQPTTPPYVFQSMGYSSVSLGREYFREYSIQRLSKKIILHLARAHWTNQVDSGNISVNQALEEQTEALYGHFKKTSGLNEKGEDNNDITDSIRSPNHKSNYKKFAQDIVSFATEGKSQQQISTWMVDVTNSYNQFVSKYRALAIQEQKSQAEIWCKSIEQNLINHIINSISESNVGAAVTLKLIERLELELKETIVDLNNEISNFKRWASSYKEEISAVIEKIGDSNKIDPSHQVWDELKLRLERPLSWNSEYSLREISIELVQELQKGFFPSIKRTVREVLELAELALDSGSYEGKEVALWSESTPTDALKPSKNEVTIESWKEFEKIYGEIVVRIYKNKTNSSLEAENLLIQDIIKGTYKENKFIKVEERWVPENTDFKDDSLPPKVGKYSSKSNWYEIKSSVESVVVDREGEFGRYIDEPLDQYLSLKKSGSQKELAYRTDAFIKALTEGLDMARPQIQVDTQFHQKVHGSKPNIELIVSAISLTEPSVKERTINAMLPYFNNDERKVENLFQSDPYSKSIQFFATFESAKDITVYQSLWEPLMKSWYKNKENLHALDDMWQWKRSRELLHSVPLQQEVINSMIAGFFTASRLDQLEILDKDTFKEVKIYSKNLEKMVSFPVPLIYPFPKAADLLASILLSLPLALGAFTFQSEENSLEPYKRLIELGKDGSNQIGSYQTVNQEIKSYLTKDKQIDEEKLNKLKEDLKKYKANYSNLRTAPLIQAGVYRRFPSLGWELSVRVSTILTKMIEALDKLDKEDSSQYI